MTNPALTAEEWATFPDWPAAKAPPNPDDLPLYYPTRHGAAAANLHKQPFGFTQKEADAIARCLPVEADSYEETMSPPQDVLDAAWSALSKIHALLPPKP